MGRNNAQTLNSIRMLCRMQQVEEKVLYERLQIATFCGQQGRISRTVRAILSGQFEGTAGLGYPGPANQY